jgi:hypothetical protein
MEGALFVQQLGAEKQTGNVVSAQSECARTTLSRQIKYNSTIARKNHTRDKFHSHLCFKIYFLVLKHFKYFTLYNYMKNRKSE